MPKIAKKLGALEVQRLTEVKLHQVGTVPGLGLRIKEEALDRFDVMETAFESGVAVAR